MRVFALAVAMLLCIATSSIAQQSRDGARAPIGTAIVSGVVTTATETPTGLRSAVVTLNHVDKTYGDTVIADDAGRFEFRGVPAGRYFLTARKDGFLTTNFGATQAGRPGTPVAVAEGARVQDLRLFLIKGGVLAGVVRHPDGAPVPGAVVEVMRVTTVGTERRTELVYGGGEHETDDRGMFRLFGLAPGNYLVRAHAEPWAMMHGAMSVHETTPADVQWARSQVQGSPLSAPPPRRPRAYAPTFYPNASSRAQAGILSLGPGEERGGIEVTTRVVSTSRIRGVVEYDGPRDEPPELHLLEVDNADSFFGLGFSHGWAFSFDGVPPGRYTITATHAKSKHWGTADVVVSGQDAEVQVRLRPPITVRGTLAFKGDTLPAPKGLAVRMTPETARGELVIAPASAPVGTDGSFELTGIMPGRYRVNPQVPAAGTWSVESIKAGDADITVAPFVLGADSGSPPLSILLTDQPTELSGRFEDASGRPATDYFIIVFSTDERAWHRESRGVAQARPATDGRFSIRALPPGNYLLAAVADVERDQWFKPEFLKELLPSAVKLTLGAGEMKVQDLRVAK